MKASALAATTDRMLEAALLGEGWNAALGGFAEAAGARGAVLVTETSRSRPVMLATTEIAEPTAIYLSGKTPPDPRIGRVWPTRTGGFVTDFDTFSREEIERDPFYAEFLHPLGAGWHACAFLNEWTSDSRIHISLKRDYRAGHYEPHEIDLIDCCLPALRTATSISHMRFNVETNGYVQALGASGEGVFEIDATGRILRTNDAALHLLDGDLELTRGRLTARNPDDQRKLERAMAAAVARPAATGVAVLTTRSASRRLVLRTAPVLGAARDVFGAALALAIIEIWQRPSAPPPQFARALHEAFTLTNMEAKVAALIAAGVSPAIAARMLGIAEGTARNHLKSAMAKAGITRQAELAAITARLTA